VASLSRRSSSSLYVVAYFTSEALTADVDARIRPDPLRST
jgi:hypothetical protein